MNKRYLRFGRSGGSGGTPGIGKKADDFPENGGYLRFGRSAYEVPLFSLLTESGAHYRKRRDVSEAAAEVQSRSTRDVRDITEGGFLRFGKSAPSDKALDVATKKKDIDDVIGGGQEYLRFGRRPGSFPRFGKRYLRFGRQGNEYLRFGKRAMS